jgi:hypothetical protein
MSCSYSGTTYTSVSGKTTTCGGPANTIGGGRGKTGGGGGIGCATTRQGIESITTSAKIIVLKLNFFIFFSLLHSVFLKTFLPQNLAKPYT